MKDYFTPLVYVTPLPHHAYGMSDLLLEGGPRGTFELILGFAVYVQQTGHHSHT